MEPVVNGLEETYRGQVDFLRIEANSPAGKTAYQTYNLRGHPGYVFLSPDGATLWSGIGQQPSAFLEEQILLALDKQPK